MYTFNVIISVAPVVFFLLALIFFDSYKLVSFRTVVLLLLIGIVVAAAAFEANTFLIRIMAIDPEYFSLYGAPIIEELFKMIYVIYLIGARKTGFLVDAAIYGFAVGCGFAVFENIYYMSVLDDPSMEIGFIRGLGTGIMHGGATAGMAIITQNAAERHGQLVWQGVLPGYILAVIVHSVFNHFLLPPVMMTLLQLIALPILLGVVFYRSEQSLRRWLDVGLDTDVELLNMIHSGHITQARVGQYLQSLKERFPGKILADMFCLIHIHLELSLRAKGIMMMRSHGFEPYIESEMIDQLDELKFLETSVGTTGRIAIHPFLHMSNRDLWHVYFLRK